MNENQTLWGFFDGSASISVSMALAVALTRCGACGGWPAFGFMKALTQEDAGVIIVATLLMFPASLTLYGGVKLFFAAKNAADRKLAEQKKRIREEGLAQGRTEGRAEGLSEGRTEGLSEGRTEGHAEGLSQGRSQERERIIKKLESSGNFTPEIARILNGETDADD